MFVHWAQHWHGLTCWHHVLWQLIDGPSHNSLPQVKTGTGEEDEEEDDADDDKQAVPCTRLIKMGAEELHLGLNGHRSFHGILVFFWLASLGLAASVSLLLELVKGVQLCKFGKREAGLRICSQLALTAVLPRGKRESFCTCLQKICLWLVDGSAHGAGRNLWPWHPSKGVPRVLRLRHGQTTRKLWQ